MPSRGSRSKNQTYRDSSGEGNDSSSDEPLSSRRSRRNNARASRENTPSRSRRSARTVEYREDESDLKDTDDSDQPRPRRVKRNVRVPSSGESTPTRSRRSKKAVEYTEKVELEDSEEEEENLADRKRKRARQKKESSPPNNNRRPQRSKKSFKEESVVDSENNELNSELDDEESESSDSPPTKKKRSNYSSKGKPSSRGTRTKKQTESESDDSSVTETRVRGGARKRKRRKKSENVDGDSDEEFVSYVKSGYSRATTGRVRNKVKNVNSGAEFDSTDEDDIIAVNVVDDVDIEGIDKVLDHRLGKVGATGQATEHFTVLDKGDPNETLDTDKTEKQYLIKWKDKAHIYNTWETDDTIDAKKVGEVKVKGVIKLHKYQQRVMDYESWKKRANPEDIEFQEIDIELGRELMKTYKEAERVFCRRKNDDEGTTEFFVKWRNLPYSEATWEDEHLVKERFLPQYELFKKLKKAKAEPKDYKKAMKGVRKKFQPMKTQPDYIGGEGYQLRDYQLDGISFLVNAWCKGNSVILADEMGLGKTIQTICFLKYLFHNYDFKGPMLVCVPLSTIAAWQNEFGQWAPDMNAITYLGDAKSREIIREYECENDAGDLCFNVLITSYEMVWKDKEFFQDIIWSNIVVDEAHRLKNEESLLYKVLTNIDSHHRLLLTGTPLQNNLKELWCLLNYLQLEDIGDWEDFEQEYGKPADVAAGYVGLHTLLKPYIIRRLKKDVEKSLPPKVEQILRVEMTKRQKNLYKMVLTKNYDFLSKGGKNQVSLINIMMQLRKTSNHLELIHDLDPEVQQTSEERFKELIYGSGKMLLLDKLLTRFKEKGDRVLIFSQMVIMLNIIEEYLQLKRFQYQRLDGSVNSDKRKQSIAQFNNPNSNDFCFLLSTKAGGLGINLQTANRVIIYDSDFNPQNDLQAIARAHRIGQKDEVQIFRFVASNSVDEDIIQKAKNKMVLDHLVIQNMDTTGKGVLGGNKKNKSEVASMSKEELNTIIKFGAADLFKDNDDAGEDEGEVDLDQILAKAETREEEEAPTSEANKELLSAFKCTNLRFMEEEQVEEKVEQPPGESWDNIIPEDFREKHKPKPEADEEEVIEGEDLYSRRKRIKRNKKRETLLISDDDGRNDDRDFFAGSDSDSDSDSEDGEPDLPSDPKLRDLVEEQRRLWGQPVNSFRCRQDNCDKQYRDKHHLKGHLREKHKVSEDLSEDNYVNLPEVKSESNICNYCSTRTSSPLDYKAHINSFHGGHEPEVNYNSSLLDEFQRYQANIKVGAKKSSKDSAKTILPENPRLKELVQTLSRLQNYPIDSFKCTLDNCDKRYHDKNHFKSHLRAKHDICDITEDNYCNLPDVQSEYCICHYCSMRTSLSLLDYKVHVNQFHGGQEPEINFNVGLLRDFQRYKAILNVKTGPASKKNMICNDCHKCFTDANNLKLHMRNSHQYIDFTMTENNYIFLPVTKSTYLRCFPCSITCQSSLAYKLHIMGPKHKSIEPEDNHDEEKIKKFEEMLKMMICLTCQDRFPNHYQLKLHMLQEHQVENYEVQDDNYYDLPQVKARVNKCQPCNRVFSKNVLYRLHIKNKHDSIEPEVNYKLLHSTLTEKVMIAVKEPNTFNGGSKRLWKCPNPKCQALNLVFPDHVGLRQHILEVHKIGKLSLSQEDYSLLPNVESTNNRCLPCNKGFLNNLRYRIHIKESHDGVEPTENVSPETVTSSEDFVCLICVKKYKGRNTLKLHLMSQHMGMEDPGEGKDALQVYEEAQDPLNNSDDSSQDPARDNDISQDSANDSESTQDTDTSQDPLNGNGESESSTVVSSEGFKEVNIESIKNNDAPVQICLSTMKSPKKKLKVLSDREKELLALMFSSLRKYGCAFCKERFEFKGQLVSHEKTHLKEIKKSKDEKIKKDTHTSAVQQHDNPDGPPCFICGAICKDASNYKNHILSHYYRNFDDHVPAKKPFNCPICQKESRDKITLIRHFGFGHKKIFEITDLKPENLIPPNSTPKRWKPTQHSDPPSIKVTDQSSDANQNGETHSEANGHPEVAIQANGDSEMPLETSPSENNESNDIAQTS